MNNGRITQTLWLCLTRSCNFDCGYCYQGSHAPAPAPHLNRYMTAEVVEAAAAWAPGWTTGTLQCVLYGGEPLLAWPLIKKLVPRFKEAFAAAGRGLTFSCTTNGSMLGPEQRAFFDEHNIGILLSLDGPPRLHDQSRTYYDTTPDGKRRGTWADIPVADILAWRPEVEIAWQLSPGIPVVAADLDEMLALGFKNINFNLQWLEEWSGDQCVRLERFFRHVGRLCLQGKLKSNWQAKLEQALTVDNKMVQPCGTGLAMLGLSPEGWLYPSQEMVYTVEQPGKAPGTSAYYRVGDVFKEPVIDRNVLARVSIIRTSQMRPPAPFDCSNCIAKSASIGGCHCRYVGQDGIDPANRFDVAPGYCQSMVAAVTGLVQAAVIERHVRPVDWLKAQAAKSTTPCAGGDTPSFEKILLTPPRQPTNAEIMEVATRLERRLTELNGLIEHTDIVRLEKVVE